jgi:hypothetical protein
MATPLRYNMTLPNGQPLRWDTPGARFGGTVEEVMAALGQQSNTMSTQNIVSGTLTETQKTAIQGAVTTILTNLPFAVDLTPQQRHDLMKAGDKSLAFIHRCRDLAAQNPAWLPKTFPSQELADDVALFDELAPIEALFISLLEKIRDTRLAAGSDSMMGSLILYGIAKAAGQGASLDGLIQQAGTRFARAGKTKVVPAAKSAS